MSPAGPVVVLSGGTGGAKLSRGLLDLIGERLVVIANTGDDVDVYGGRVCPDPDLVLFQLADRLDERGWGLAGDTFEAMAQLEEIGAECWFRLGDRDLAIALDRARRLAAGERLTEVIASLALSFGIEASILPMCDEQVATFVTVSGRRRPFQEFMIVDGAQGEIEGIEFEGIELAGPPQEVLEAIAAAETIVIGPSNPAISIDPILAVPGMSEAIRTAAAPVVCVSPLVGDISVKGPTMSFLEAIGVEPSPAGIARHYGDLVDVLIADRAADGIASHVCDVLMEGLQGQVRLASEVLDAAAAARDRQ